MYYEVDLVIYCIDSYLKLKGKIFLLWKEFLKKNVILFNYFYYFLILLEEFEMLLYKCIDKLFKLYIWSYKVIKVINICVVVNILILIF